MKKLMKYMLDKIKKFEFFDIALLKICLITIGVIIGAYTWVFIRNWVWIFVSIAVVSWVILAIRIFKKK